MISLFIIFAGNLCNIMKKEEPIRLNFPRLSDIISEGLLLSKKITYITSEFAMMYLLHPEENKLFSLNQPYRLAEPRVGLVLNGNAKMQLNLIDHQLEKGMMIYLGSNTIMQPYSFSPDLNMIGIAITEEFMQMIFNGRIPQTFIGDFSYRLLFPTEEEHGMMFRMMKILWDFVHCGEYSKEVAESMIAAIYSQLDYVSRKNAEETRTKTTREREIFNSFMVLLHKYSKKERNISFYADKMCLSERYIGSLIKEASGKTAKEWIEQSVIAEAKVMLKHTDMQVTQITDELNFPSASFFCKFFKRLTSMTPQEYRNK